MGQCPLCGTPISAALLARSSTLLPPIVRTIQREHPAWTPAQGICPPCALRYAGQYAAARSATSLQMGRFPHTTFPYYHPEETHILGLPERLPDYPAFTGRGITIAFLDSGYYPHPDLIDGDRMPVDLLHSESEVSRTRRLMEKQPLRIRQYLNLFEGKEYVGLDAPSLWSDAPNSWHGQMTSAIAAGNGLLSGGRYRGFAPQAGLLPIKIGRANGSIPEAEIAHGLRWLLRDENFKRYGVRVLNVSVGGDFPQNWDENKVCLAVEELTQRGVLVVAASGNANRADLLAPAQSPSALTVGGVNDHNRRWHSPDPADLAYIELYHHNWGVSVVDDGQLAKPEIVAPALWVPAPILPVSAIFREMWVLGQAWDALERDDLAAAQRILWEWHSVLALEPAIQEANAQTLRAALRLRMNPHKFTHAHYQHVDGTSVSAPQVAAVAAQMLQANPTLTPAQLKAILIESAQPLPHLAAEKSGAGLLMPALAVAAALRAPGGALNGYPQSATQPGEAWLREVGIPVKVANSDAPRICYFGLYAPDASAVSLTGSFNGWHNDDLPLMEAENGWWHLGVALSAGLHLYRFLAVDAATAQASWLPDPENPRRAESGYTQPHSVINI